MRAWPAILLIAVSLAGCQGEDSDADRDDDGLTDLEEQGGWMVTVEHVDRRETYQVFSDPGERDTDGDGLWDTVEFLNGLDPTKADTDGDGLTDCQETTDADLDNCESQDFACDDGSCSTGTDPNDADSDTLLSRYVVDTLGWTDAPAGAGGDGVLDGDEIAGYEIQLGTGITLRVTTDPRQIDTDNDGLHDGEERLRFRSHGDNPDTDGDGCEDGNDIFPRQGPGHQDGRLGLHNITVHNDADGDGSARVQVQFIVSSGGNHLVPGEPRTVAEGSALALADVRLDLACPAGVQTHDPWVQIHAIAYDHDADTPTPLAIDGDAATASIWWNLHRARFATEPSPVGVAGPVEFTGGGATLWFDPNIDADEPAIPVE